MKVPFLDLQAQYESIRDEISIAMQKVLDKTAFASGPFVDQFEEEFAEFCQCSEAVGVNSGTSALWLTMLGLGIGEGDEVITVPNTFIATAEAISFCGAKPVFVDVEERTFTMNPAKLEKAISKNTKAIIPVHIYGQMADMDSIMEIARAKNVYVIEDAAQAHGAEYKGRSTGSIGDAGCFSFYPGKNLGAYGEGGAIVTNNHELARNVRMLRDHGQSKKYYHKLIGWNSRMDGLQGAVLGVKLKHLRTWNEARRKNAKKYNQLLRGVSEIIIPYEAEYAKHVYHIYSLHTSKRDEVIRTLKDNDIACGMHYPVPIHLQEAYSYLELGKGSFPVAEKSATEQVSLPMFPELKEDQIDHITKLILN